MSSYDIFSPTWGVQKYNGESPRPNLNTELSNHNLALKQNILFRSIVNEIIDLSNSSTGQVLL